ncbi:tia invasion determinant [Brachyspira intermedia]|uniref:tia invasion determinant n=1 Tax=Brachyspira intermedia TaxID=84377 RepID=UPI0030065155
MKFLIRKFLLISILSVCFTNMLMSMDIGAYLAPKFIFNVGDSKIKLQGNNKNTLNMYVGGGLALGYNFDIFHKYSTVRVEFEYLYRNALPGNAYKTDIKTINSHTFLIGAYYDYNFLYVNYDNPDSIRSQLNGGKRPVMSVYAGFILGGQLDSYITCENFEYHGLFKTSKYYNKAQFVYGFGGGLAFHITEIVSIDLGYRLLLNTSSQLSHDVVASVRLNF